MDIVLRDVIQENAPFSHTNTFFLFSHYSKNLHNLGVFVIKKFYRLKNMDQ